MNSLKKIDLSKAWNMFSKVLAVGALVWQNFHYMQTEPFMDVINGSITGMVVYAIFFAKERTQ